MCSILKLSKLPYYLVKSPMYKQLTSSTVPKDVDMLISQIPYVSSTQPRGQIPYVSPTSVIDRCIRCLEEKNFL